MSEQGESRLSREWMKFFVLAGILAGAILVVALVRPFIFNRIVPAVMGEGRLSAPMPVDTEAEQPSSETPVEEVTPTATEEEAKVPEEQSLEEEEMPTAVATLTHIVQPGETLTQIARRFNVSVNDIVAANNLPNPNHIEVGHSLLIPQP